MKTKDLVEFKGFREMSNLSMNTELRERVIDFINDAKKEFIMNIESIFDRKINKIKVKVDNEFDIYNDEKVFVFLGEINDYIKDRLPKEPFETEVITESLIYGYDPLVLKEILEEYFNPDLAKIVLSFTTTYIF